MITWIIWFWSLVCPNPNHTLDNHGSCNMIHFDGGNNFGEGDDGGDETGNFPPKLPPPPPHP